VKFRLRPSVPPLHFRDIVIFLNLIRPIPLVWFPFLAKRACCMSVPDDRSYFSRFVVKFLEIIAAGLATAVSGYLIAHLSGALSSSARAPAATVIQAIPTTSVLLAPQPSAPISANINEQRPAPQEANTARLAQPTRKTVNSTHAEPPRKHMESTTNAAERSRDQESFVARVQAALANANRTDPLEASPQQGDVKRGPAAIGQPGTDSSGTAVSTPSAAVHEAAPNPLTAVEINSRPIAVAPAPPTAAETSVFSGVDQLLRHDPLAGTDEAPRPPMPVGQ
jgi:hypothetical protein